MSTVYVSGLGDFRVSEMTTRALQGVAADKRAILTMREIPSARRDLDAIEAELRQRDAAT